MAEHPRSFLIAAPDRVGELVMAQSLFIGLKNRDPACRIEVLAPPGLFPLLERMPQIAKAIPLPEGFERFRLSDRLSFAGQIRANGFSQAILLNTGWRYALLALLARIPLRTGYSAKTLLNDARTADKRWTTLEKFVALGLDDPADVPSEPALPNLDIGLHNQLQVKEKFSIVDSLDPVLALCPGGGASLHDRWGIEGYARLARDAIDRGWQVWLLGEEMDHLVGSEIRRIAGCCQNFMGRTSLAEAIDLLSLADVVVTNYSGLMHVALALQRQVLIMADSKRIDSPACAQSGARPLPLDASPEQVFSELPGG
ncbi:MAG: lipopolysaccharide heptosyltransferase II [Methylococcaceae bacterium]|nr:lipopolysaccharide heptosyltransferase II [Methylococcaceae bacterium]